MEFEEKCMEKILCFFEGKFVGGKSVARWGWNVSINSPLGTVENGES